MSTTQSPLLTVNPLLANQGNTDDWLNLNASSHGNGSFTTEPPNTGPALQDYTMFKVIEAMSKYYLWVILAVGVPGNLASIFTILSMPTVSSSKAHVAILALADTLAIILKITYHQVSFQKLNLTTPGCILVMFLQQFFSSYVNWVVVAMTLERFLAVWFPLRVGRIYTRKKALYVLGLFAMLTAAVFFCFFWAWIEKHEPSYGYWCQVKSEWEEFISKKFYWIEAMYSSIIPCYLILTGNALIILNIRRARRAQRHLTNSFEQRGRTARDQRQITVMLAVVSAVFLVLNLPNAILYIIKTNWGKSRDTYERVQRIFTLHFIQILTNCNHAVNFYLYFLSMSTFRRRFMDAIRCRKMARRRPTGSVYRTSQTYVQSAPLSETSRTEMSTGRYINAYSLKRNGSNADSHHSLKSCSSGNLAKLSIHTDNSSHVTANSEV